MGSLGALAVRAAAVMPPGKLAVLCVTEAVLPLMSALVWAFLVRWSGSVPRPDVFGAIWFGTAAFLAVIFPVAGVPWPLTASIVLSALAAAIYWWWHRRKRRDRAPRAYGAKSWARVWALVRKQRQAARPAPVLRPVPGGAR